MKSEKSEYRLVYGVAYPNLYKGKNQPKIIQANLNDRNEFYHDDAVRLNQTDIQHFIGKPICLEHDKSDVVGEITSVFVDSKNKMRINARIYTGSTRGKKIFKAIDNGELKGLSVGYSSGLEGKETNKISYKEFDEISICNKPFFETSNISVTASLKNNILNKAKEKKNLWIKLSAMSDEQVQENTQTMENAEVVPIPENTDASELMKQADKTQETNKNLLEENAAMKERMARLEVLEAQEAKRESERVKREDKKAEEYVKLVMKQYKSANGGNDDINQADYAETVKNTFRQTDPRVSNAVKVMASNAMYTQKLETENESWKKRFEEIEAKLKMGTEKLIQVNANAKTEATKNEIRVGASSASTFPAKNNSLISGMFVPSPSAAEKRLREDAYGAEDDYNNSMLQVNASGGIVQPKKQKIIQVKAHRNSKNISSNSMRDVCPSMFGFMQTEQDWASIPVRKFKVTNEGFNPNNNFA